MLNPKTDFIIEMNENEGKAQWMVSSQLAYFDGHFPNNPILPAVAIIDVSTEILRRALKLDEVKIKSIISCKFTRPILPGASIEIDFRESHKNEWNIKWTPNYPHESGSSCAQLRLLLREPTHTHPEAS